MDQEGASWTSGFSAHTHWASPSGHTWASDLEPAPHFGHCFLKYSPESSKSKKSHFQTWKVLLHA